jgi:pyruvate formate lyase activating enzyme
MNDAPLIVDIKRCSLEDGPGIRSVVFFKGCPLRCVFCQNPETQNPGVEIAFLQNKCLGCGRCAAVCKYGAIDLQSPGRIRRDSCVLCGECADACPSSSLRRVGTLYSVGELAEILLRDAAFYSHSGGGVTLSGGECALHPEYVGRLLKRLKAEDIHITIETAGHFDWSLFKEKILPYADLIYYDVKFFDKNLHERYTGKSSERILHNLKLLLQEERIEVLPRIPLVPGVTATEENFTAIAKFLREAGADAVSLLPYNPMGFEMLTGLGRQRPDLPSSFMKPEEEKTVHTVFQKILGKQCRATAAQDISAEKTSCQLC